MCFYVKKVTAMMICRGKFVYLQRSSVAAELRNHGITERRNYGVTEQWIYGNTD